MRAIEHLRVKGLASADKKSSRAADEGIVYSYIHSGDRLGVMIELRCETDFVARTDDFKQLAKDLSMQVAAMHPVAIDETGFAEEVIEAERRVYIEQALESGKPQNIAEKMVEGKLKKFMKERALLDQIFIKNQPEEKNRTVREYLQQSIGKLGENIQVARFARFELGSE